MDDYNVRYYNVAVRALENMKYYYDDLFDDCTAYLLRYFPDADKEELAHAINWALADTWGDGCEYETI